MAARGGCSRRYPASTLRLIRQRLPYVLGALGALLLAGVLLAVLLGRGGGREGAPPPHTTAPAPPATTQPPPPPPAQPPPPATTAPGGLAISDVRLASVSPFSAVVSWRTSAPASSRVAYGLADAEPTLWTAPAGPTVDHRAVLAGLSYSTSYHATIAAATPDGQTAELALDFQTPGAPTDARPSISGGAVLLDGQPIFPLMAWSLCEYYYSGAVAQGINLFAKNPCSGLQGQVGNLAGSAFSAGTDGDPPATGQGLIGWFYPDEADIHGATGESLPPTPEGLLSFLTLSNHFYSAAAPLPQGRAMYPGLVARADFVGFDLYPLQNWCQPDRIGDVYDAQKELVALAAGKPTFQWIEAATMDCSPSLAVTPEVVRAESWLAIAGGAHGLGFFPVGWTAEVGNAIGGVARDVKALLPALLAPPAPASVEPPGGPVRAGARAYNGALYVIAVNPSYQPTQATFRVPGLAGRTLSVLGESRTVTAAADTFTDAFAPLAAHVYVAAPT